MVRPISLRAYLNTRLFGLIVPIALAGIAVHWRFERSLLQSQFDESLAERASTLATLVTVKQGRLELEFADEYMPQYSRPVHPSFFQVWHADGQSLERSYSLRGADLPFVAGTLEQPASFETVLPDGVAVRCVGIEFPVRLGTDPAVNPANAVVIAVGADVSVLERKLERGVLEVAVTGGISLLGILLAVHFASRRGASLLERVAADVETITPRSLARPLDEARTPVEIRPIVASLNRALGTIRSFVERERRFNADVAHELRTPIAELRTAAEVAQRWPGDDSAARLASQAREIALHMGGLVESLLELASLESGEVGEIRHDFDLVRCVGLLAEHALEAESGGRSIAVEAPDALLLATRPRLWEVALRNLLDNAMSHSPPGSRITVRLGPDGDGARVEFANPCSALEEEDVARCTRRLWSGGGSTDGGHHGLGLSLVEAAAAKLGHRFAVELREGSFLAAIGRTGPEPPEAGARVHTESLPSNTSPPNLETS